MSFWPNRGEPDPRPPLGAPYRRVAPVAPAPPGRAGGRPAPALRRLAGALIAVPAMPARILVAEDDAPSPRPCAARWSTRASRSTVVGDGPAALGAGAREPPDLVVLDVMLPGLDGIEVCRRAAGRAARRRSMLMLTARDATADRVARARRRRRRLPGQAVRVRGAAGPGPGAAAPPAAPRRPAPLTLRRPGPRPGHPRGAPRRPADRADRAGVRPAATTSCATRARCSPAASCSTRCGAADRRRPATSSTCTSATCAPSSRRRRAAPGADRARRRLRAAGGLTAVSIRARVTLFGIGVVALVLVLISVLHLRAARGRHRAATRTSCSRPGRRRGRSLGAAPPARAGRRRPPLTPVDAVASGEIIVVVLDDAGGGAVRDRRGAARRCRSFPPRPAGARPPDRRRGAARCRSPDVPLRAARAPWPRADLGAVRVRRRGADDPAAADRPGRHPRRARRLGLHRARGGGGRDLVRGRPGAAAAARS